MNLASGELRTESGDLLLRTNTKRETGEEFENIVLLAKADGTFLRLGDVATIRDGFVDMELINEFNGRAALFIQVRASESEDTLTIARDIKDFLAHYEPLEGITVGIWADQSEFLSDRLSLLVRNGTHGFALVFLFLVVMLDLRLAIWVAMGVPISFLGAFLFFDFLGVNINMVSLFALIIVLGIVVDDAVVVGENIITEHEAGHRGVVGAFPWCQRRHRTSRDRCFDHNVRIRATTVCHRNVRPDPGDCARCCHHCPGNVSDRGILHPAGASVSR